MGLLPAPSVLSKSHPPVSVRDALRSASANGLIVGFGIFQPAEQHFPMAMR